MQVSLAKTIATEAASRPEGALISAKELLHLGSRAAVDQALSRLVKSNELMRAGCGLYVRPIQTRFGVRAPAPEKVVECLAKSHAETVVPHGAAAANALGLTTQVPVKAVYYTSGPNRSLKLGEQSVELQSKPSWMLKKEQAGEAVRALEWLGKEQAGPALETLKRALSPQAVEELVALRPVLPTWLSRSISETLMAHG